MTDVLFVVLAMFGVIALMLGTIFLMKKLTNRISGGRAAKGLKISACIGVGQDKTVMAVRAGGKSLLIGVTPTGINKLCDLDEADMEIIESGGENSAVDASMAGKSFPECLKYNFRKLGGELMSPYSDKSDEDNKEEDKDSSLS